MAGQTLFVDGGLTRYPRSSGRVQRAEAAMSHTPIGDPPSPPPSAALVDTASVEWLSFPRFDSPSVLGRLLDGEAGHWQVRPVGEWRSRRRYIDRTLVLETTFTSGSGTVVLTDLMAMGADNGGHRLGTAVPLRVRRISSPLERWRWRWNTGANGVQAGGAAARCSSWRRHGAWWRRVVGPHHTGRPRTRRRCGDRAAASRRGRDGHLALHRSTLEETPARIWSQQELSDVVDRTVDAWVSWSEMHQSYDGPWADLVHHSGRVLQGLSFQPSGAIVAAATTSLPESVGGERNWDYRYSWVRDTSFTMEALWVAACPTRPTTSSRS